MKPGVDAHCEPKQKTEKRLQLSRRAFATKSTQKDLRFKVSR
jgi:hypothetical protein